MVLKMGDAVTVSNLPPGLDAYAGYENGLYQTMDQLAARFPGKRLLGISVFLADVGQFLDVERYDATPDQASAYWHMRRAAGVTRPGMYASISVMPDVVNALSNAGITRTEYRLWSAHYQFGEHICGPSTCNYNANVQRVETPWCDGTQWTNNGGLWDTSLLLDDFFIEGVDRPPMANSNPLPPNVKVLSVQASWAGPNRTDPNNELDVFMVGDDGKVYHKWYIPTSGWRGPEILNDPI
jgi:hypothetical protein